MFFANRSLPSASNLASELFQFAPAIPSPSAPAPGPASHLGSAHSSLKSQAQVARALGLSGMEALTYLAQSGHHPRPMINALLDKLAIQGMAT